ncbi:hemoglobin subunit alpha-3-like [Rana temporaria]|uniref:hemoglobin subunit alpha-3-like n=1 Tax=Rana temporaria TaxID=8407 RepID=UPI001AAD3F6F|nr:hemoglobin subunit alpha-3-like [Rana temporaria]
MKFSASEKAAVLSMMAKISPKAGDLGAEILHRLLICCPQMEKKLNFDVTPGSADLKTHGAKIMNSLASAANHMDNLADNQSSLSDLRAYNLRVDPGNFALLIQVIQGVMDSHFHGDLTPEVQAAWNKFTGEVSEVLTSENK